MIADEARGKIKPQRQMGLNIGMKNNAEGIEGKFDLKRKTIFSSALPELPDFKLKTVLAI